METYHGFDYDINSFNKNEALAFMLNHYVFMDSKLRPEALQHLFITEANNIVTQMEKSYELRKRYEAFRATNTKIIWQAILAFTLMVICTVSSLSTISISSAPSKVFITTILVVGIIVPILILARQAQISATKSKKLLIAIHNVEMKITTMMTFAAQKNTISMVEQRLSQDDDLNKPGITLN